MLALKTISAAVMTIAGLSTGGTDQWEGSRDDPETPAAVTAQPTMDASDATADEDDPIVVTAPPTPLERQKELRKLVRAIMREPRSGRTIGTFFDPVCPKVFGLPDAVAEVMQERIRANVETLDANRRNSSADCKHNLSVVFVPPSEGSAHTWFDGESEHLHHLKSYERAWVVEEDGPVRAWTYDLMRSADGHVLADGTGEGSSGTQFQNRNRISFASRLQSPITMEIAGAVVMIELASVDGRTIEQLADYATMRGIANLGGIGPNAAPVAPTILTLFQDDAEDAPGELTTFDRAFLSKLYGASRNTTERQYYSKIAAQAAQEERNAGEAPGQRRDDTRLLKEGSSPNE